MSNPHPAGRTPPPTPPAAPAQQGSAPYSHSPTAPGEQKKGRGCLIAALIVALLVLMGTGVGAWFVLGIGKGKTVWSLPYSGEGEDRQNYLSTWFTDSTVVRAQSDGISALDLGSGKRQWGLPAPGKESVICAASKVTSQDVAVLAYGKTGECTSVFAVDLDSGKKLWDLPVKKAEEEPSFAVSGSAVVVNDKTAYGLRDGKRLWATKQLPDNDGCSAGAFTGGSQLVRTQACPTKKDEFGEVVRARHTVSQLDPVSGKARWTYKARQQDTVDWAEMDGEILSTAPVVVREAEGAYRVLSTAGKPRGLVKLRGGNSLGQDTAFFRGAPHPAIAAESDTLLVEQELSSKGESVDAFDINSGKRLWTTGPARDVRYDLVQGAGKLTAVKYDNDTFSFDSQGHPFSLVTFDPTSGEEEEQSSFDGVGEALGVYSMPYLHQNRLFLASVSDEGSIGSLEDLGGIDSGHDSSLIALIP